MLRINAYHYIQAAELLTEIQNCIDLGRFNGSAAVSDEAIQLIIGTLPNLATHCKSLGLDATYALVTNFLNGYQVFASNPMPVALLIQRGSVVPLLSAPTRQDANIQIRCIKSSFETELQARLFAFIPPQRAPYFSDEHIGSEIATILGYMGEFAGAKTDLIEAGNCFAAGCFTASVYHLMRTAEYGLVAVASSVGVVKDKQTSWDRLIQGIEAEIKKMVSSDTKPSGWREQEKEYRELCAWFISVQKGWRNPVSHVPWTYSEAVAKGMFSAIGALFSMLSRYGIQQSDMPKTLMPLPEPES